MAQNNDTEKELYDLLVTSGFDPVTSTKKGSPGQPEGSTVISFDYRGSSGKSYGPATLVRGDEDELLFMFGDNLARGMDDADKREYLDEFLPKLSNFAKRHHYRSFNSVNISQLKHTRAGMAAIREGLFENYYGTRRVSYMGQPQEARLMIRHNRILGENDVRYRYIESLFIETQDQERFRLPFTNLSGGRAMLEHVRQGGRPYDVRGAHISEIVQEMKILARFHRANQHRVLEGQRAELVSRAQDYYQQLRENITGLATSRGYRNYFENWNPVEITDGESLVENIRNMFVEQHIDHRVEAALPILARLEKNNMKEADIFEDWATSLVEGGHDLADDRDAQRRLGELLAQDTLAVGPDGIDIIPELEDIIGYDRRDPEDNRDFEQLKDRLITLSRENSADADAAPLIRAWLSEKGIDVDLDLDAEKPVPNAQAPAPETNNREKSPEPQQPMSEGKVKDKDLERQDYERMTPRQFQAAYKMSKAEWKAKNLWAFSGNKPSVEEGIIGKRHRRPDYYHIVYPNGNPANLVGYRDQTEAIAVRDREYPTAQVKLVGPRGAVKGVFERDLDEVFANIESGEPGTDPEHKPTAKSSQTKHQTGTQCPKCGSPDIKTYSDGEKECHQCHKTWDVKDLGEGLPGPLSASDYMPGARTSFVSDSCKTCHGRKVMYRLGSELYADNKKGAVRIKCPTCGGTGYKTETQGVAEGFNDIRTSKNITEGENYIPTAYEKRILSKIKPGYIVTFRGGPDDVRISRIDGNRVFYTTRDLSPGFDYVSQIIKIKPKKDVEEGQEGWKVTKEIPGTKRVSTKEIQGNTVTKIEVWNTGKTGRTMRGSPAIGSWKTRGYRVDDKFYRQYKDAAKAARKEGVAEGSYKTNIGQRPKGHQAKQQSVLDKRLTNKKSRLGAETQVNEAARAIPGSQAWLDTVQRARALGQTNAELLYNRFQNVPKRHFLGFLKAVGITKIPHDFELELKRAEKPARGQNPAGPGLAEGFSDTDTVFLTPAAGHDLSYLRYKTFREATPLEHEKAIQYHLRDADRATPRKAAFHDMRAKMHQDWIRKVTNDKTLTKSKKEDSPEVTDESRFDDPLTGWHIVYRKSQDPVHNTPSFGTREQAQKYLMTQMFANHQDYEVKHTADLGEGDNLATFVGPNEDAMDRRGAVTDSFYEELSRIKNLARI